MKAKLALALVALATTAAWLLHRPKEAPSPAHLGSPHQKPTPRAGSFSAVLRKPLAPPASAPAEKKGEPCLGVPAALAALHLDAEDDGYGEALPLLKSCLANASDPIARALAKCSPDEPSPSRDCRFAIVLMRAKWVDETNAQKPPEEIDDDAVLANILFHRFLTNPDRGLPYARRLFEIEPEMHAAGKAILMAHIVQMGDDTLRPEIVTEIDEVLDRCRDLAPEKESELRDIEESSLLLATKFPNPDERLDAMVARYRDESSPFLSLGLLYLGVHHARNGRNAEALAALQEAQTLAPRDPRIERALGVTRALKPGERAKKILTVSLDFSLPL